MVCYNMSMLPIESRIKIFIESMFLVVLLTYALRSLFLKAQHVSAGIAVLLSIPIIIDVAWFHCIRSPQVWAVLNIPFITVVAVFCYVRIFKKSMRKLRQKLAMVVTLLFGA
jgi:hypothetical protein